MRIPLTLAQARKKINEYISLTESEKVDLEDGLGRIVATSHYAKHPQPSFDQSTYDGFVIPEKNLRKNDGQLIYRIAGEIAAGDSNKRKHVPGVAYRIMTGAPLPAGAWKVVPQEVCDVDGDMVSIPEAQVVAGKAHIKKRGSDFRKKSLLVRAGVALTPLISSTLADCGLRRIEVYKKPNVSFFCTGSELVDSSDKQVIGKKISSNRYLLDGLIRSSGANAHDGGVVIDDEMAMANLLEDVVKEKPDIIISTGGMGPGKYDLLEKTFSSFGGKVVFNSLKIRPGKSALFGTLGKCLYFGMPGPPPAVHALFHALIKPALMKVQGYGKQSHEKIIAYLDEDLFMKRNDLQHLREGVTSLQNGVAKVRLAGKGESFNCYLLWPSNKIHLKKDQAITILPLAQLPYLATT